MRILVVEDEKRIADFLSRGLESAGYAVDVAATAATAIDLIHSTDYDLVILDLMPAGHGRPAGAAEDPQPQGQSAGADL